MVATCFSKKVENQVQKKIGRQNGSWGYIESGQDLSS